MGQRAEKRARRELAALNAEVDAYMATPYLQPTPACLSTTRTLDLGKASADRDWYTANPGRLTMGDEGTAEDYRDALGPVKDNVGRTITGRTWQ